MTGIHSFAIYLINFTYFIVCARISRYPARLGTIKKGRVMANTRTLVIGLMVFTGMLTPVEVLRADCRITGKLYYNDGVTSVSAPDTVAVEVHDIDGNLIAKNTSGGPIVTLHGTTGYSIVIAPSDIKGNDKSITIIYKLNGNADRQVQRVNTQSTSLIGQVIDVGFTKAPLKRTPGRAVTGVITGTWVYEDGVTPIAWASQPNIHVYFADGTELKPIEGSSHPISICSGPFNTTYTIRVHVPAEVADKTVRVQFMLGKSLDAIFDSVLGDDQRVQTVDISGQQQPPAPECVQPCCGRPRHGFLRGRRR